LDEDGGLGSRELGDASAPVACLTDVKQAGGAGKDVKESVKEGWRPFRGDQGWFSLNGMVDVPERDRERVRDRKRERREGARVLSQDRRLSLPHAPHHSSQPPPVVLARWLSFFFYLLLSVWYCFT
jgi:hypothetical protein